MTHHPPDSWLAALEAELAARGETVKFSSLPQRDIDDIAHRWRIGDTPARAAAVLCGERPVPLPWVPRESA